MDGDRSTLKLKKAVRGSVSRRSKNKPATTTHQLHTQRFTFFPKQKKKYDKKPKKNRQHSCKDSTLRPSDRPSSSTREDEKAPQRSPTSIPTSTKNSKAIANFQTTVPTWDAAAVAVFPDSSSCSTCETPNTYDYGSNADFIPKCKPPWAEAAKMFYSLYSVNQSEWNLFNTTPLT